MKATIIIMYAILLSFSSLAQNFRQEGEASYVSEDYQGSSTKSGNAFDNTKNLAAHPFLPMNTVVRVTNLDNNKSVEVKIIDRCTCQNRVINISKTAASQIGLLSAGKAKVRVESIGIIPPHEDFAEVSKSVLPAPVVPVTTTKREFKSSDEDGLLHLKSETEPTITYVAATETKALPTPVSSHTIAPSNTFNNAGTYNFAGQAIAPKGMGLQVGVFSSLQGMKNVCEELKSQGINTKELFIQVVAKDGGKLFKVLVGSYANQSPELTNKLKELTDKGYKALVKTYL